MGAGSPAARERVVFCFSHQGDFLGARGCHPYWPGCDGQGVSRSRRYPGDAARAWQGAHRAPVSSSQAKVASAAVALRPLPARRPPELTELHRGETGPAADERDPTPASVREQPP